MTNYCEDDLDAEGGLRPDPCPSCGRDPKIVNAEARCGVQFVAHPNGILPDDGLWFEELLVAMCGHRGEVLLEQGITDRNSNLESDGGRLGCSEVPNWTLHREPLEQGATNSGGVTAVDERFSTLLVGKNFAMLRDVRIDEPQWLNETAGQT